ncbi:DUF5997 family protein [Spelaeicoccus albus]
MKPETAAKKLGIYVPAAPEEFRSSPVTRDEFDELRTDPPEWLTRLRANGPHPRPVVAHKLGVSISGLARGGVTEPLTTEQISALLSEMPEWLKNERATHARVREEELRAKGRSTGKSAK